MRICGSVMSPGRATWLPLGSIIDSVSFNASARRPVSARVIPRAAASIASCRPIPDPAPVISAIRDLSCIAPAKMAHRQLAEDVAVEAVDDLRGLDDDAMRRMWKRVRQLLEKGDVLDVERAV